MNEVAISPLDKPLSSLIMGTAALRSDRYEEAARLLDAYLHAGGRTLDTAENYGRGMSERLIGRWLRERGNRDSVTIITKGGHPYNHCNRVDPTSITEDLTGSLERLQTDYIDVYLLHRDDPGYPVAPLMETLNRHMKNGLIRSIGVSNWTVPRIQEANAYAESQGLAGFACNSPNFSLAKPLEPMWPGCVSADDAMLKWHEETQVPLLSWASQARGFFTGRFAPERTDDADMVRVYYADGNWERFRRAAELAALKGCDTVQIVLAYVLSQSFPVCGIIGARTVEEIQSNFDAMSIQLSGDEVRWLDLSESNGEE